MKIASAWEQLLGTVGMVILTLVVAVSLAALGGFGSALLWIFGRYCARLLGWA